MTNASRRPDALVPEANRCSLALVRMDWGKINLGSSPDCTSLQAGQTGMSCSAGSDDPCPGTSPGFFGSLTSTQSAVTDRRHDSRFGKRSVSRSARNRTTRVQRRTQDRTRGRVRWPRVRVRIFRSMLSRNRKTFQALYKRILRINMPPIRVTPPPPPSQRLPSPTPKSVCDPRTDSLDQLSASDPSSLPDPAGCG